ncbi:MAG: hypothetical protein K2G39_06525, partial [Lachnospiraceae bacterium]|nr:hypothetical protein [Lachnospiraceae bacterium]
MKKIVYKSKAIQAVILIAAACLLVFLWPLRIWRETVTTSVSPVQGTVTEAINNEKTLLQGIVAQYDHMDTIEVYLGENCTGDTFYLRILDEQWQQVCEEKAVIDKEALPGFQQVMIDVDMEVGKMYYVILQGNDSEIFAGYEAVSMTEMPYLGTMYYADDTQEGVSLAANYHYSMPLRKSKVLVLGGLIAAAAAALCLAVCQWYKKREDKLITVEKAFKAVMNPLVAVFCTICLVAVALGVCGSYLLDNTVYFISVVLLSAIVFYGINHNRDGQQAVLTWEYIKSHMGDLIQSIAIAGAMAGCCEYMSGLYDIHHTVAERKEMLWFSFAVIAMFKWKEIVNLYNAVYLAGAGIYGYYYFQTHVTEEMDVLAVQALKHTVWIAILLGLIVIRTVIALIKKKTDGSGQRSLAKPAYLYAGLLVLFFAMIILFRNGRWWGVAMVVAFTLFYLNYGMWEHKDRLLVNVARGVILQFAWSTGYALLHRPYVTFRNARYTHIFHTVTITATYFTIVECAAVVILCDKLRKSRKLKDCWKELTLFGVVSSYMLFTMSRTAFFAVGVAVLFALLVTASGKGRKRSLSFIRNLGMAIAAVAVCLPVTFSVQRNVPILASDPFLYEIEYSMYCPEDVMRGRNLDSKNFMRVGRFIDVFAEKIFGIPEGTFDIYGEIEEYERTHPKQNAAKAAEENALDVDLVASADGIPKELSEGMDEIPEDNDYTNGRLDIFRSYIEQLNMTGHEEMGAVLKNGEIATHAHNIYLQVAYDHGIFVGILFVIVGVATFIKSCLYYHKKKDK